MADPIKVSVEFTVTLKDKPELLEGFFKRFDESGNEPAAAATELVQAVTGPGVVDTVALRTAIFSVPANLAAVKRAAGWKSPEDLAKEKEEAEKAASGTPAPPAPAATVAGAAAGGGRGSKTTAGAAGTEGNAQ